MGLVQQCAADGAAVSDDGKQFTGHFDAAVHLMKFVVVQFSAVHTGFSFRLLQAETLRPCIRVLGTLFRNFVRAGRTVVIGYQFRGLALRIYHVV